MDALSVEPERDPVIASELEEDFRWCGRVDLRICVRDPVVAPAEDRNEVDDAIEADLPVRLPAKPPGPNALLVNEVDHLLGEVDRLQPLALAVFHRAHEPPVDDVALRPRSSLRVAVQRA